MFFIAILSASIISDSLYKGKEANVSDLISNEFINTSTVLLLFASVSVPKLV